MKRSEKEKARRYDRAFSGFSGERYARSASMMITFFDRPPRRRSSSSRSLSTSTGSRTVRATDGSGIGVYLLAPGADQSPSVFVHPSSGGAHPPGSAGPHQRRDEPGAVLGRSLVRVAEDSLCDIPGELGRLMASVPTGVGRVVLIERHGVYLLGRAVVP